MSTLESGKCEMIDLKRTRLVVALVSLVTMRPRDNPNHGRQCISTGGF